MSLHFKGLMQLKNSAVYAYYISNTVYALFVLYVKKLQDEPSSAAAVDGVV